MATGERYCFLADRETGLPEFYSLLYVTTQIRNNSKSFSFMEQAFSAINVLIHFLGDRGLQDLEERFLKRDFLAFHESESLRAHCQKDFEHDIANSSTGNVIPLSAKNGYKAQEKIVSNGTQYTRLTHIADFVSWLAKFLLTKSYDREISLAVEAMKQNLLTLRPARSSADDDDLGEGKGLSREQEALLMEVVRPGSELNPFKRKDIQIRNELMVQTLQALGNRGGELLNLRIDDIDEKRGEIVIRRRPDAKEDPRLRQPKAKTRARRLPMDSPLVASFRNYIVKIRKRIPNAATHGYIFVTHKSGPTLGQPLSISAYEKIICQIAEAHPLLAELTGHVLRHTWNDRFSEHMDNKPNPEPPSVQERIREDLMGWAEDSGTAKIYNKRFIRRKGRQVGLEMQEEAYQKAVDLKINREKTSKKK